MKEIIRQFDTSLMTKAGKVDFFEMRQELEFKMTKEEVEANNQFMDERIDGFRDEMKKLETTLKFMQEGMS